MLSRLVIVLVRAYQATLSPMLGSGCRFYPSCSEYCIEAVSKHGAVRGLLLGIRRLLRCHPFHPGGIDLVPEPSGTRRKNGVP